MANTVIPQLGPQGYVNSNTSPGEVMQLEFAHMWECDFSQSVVFAEKVHSLQYLIHEYSKKPEELMNQMRRMLIDSIGKHFDDIEVDVYKKVNNEDAPDVEYGIIIEMVGYKNGERVDLSKELSVNATENTGRLINSLNR